MKKVLINLLGSAVFGGLFLVVGYFILTSPEW